jgi:hypothetical protein
VSWLPNDLVSDADLTAYESTVLTQFNKTDWTEKRAKAIEDWLWPILRAQGFSPQKFRTRYEADAVVGYTGSAYTDATGAASSTAVDDLDLAAIFATAASDRLYVGSTQQFRGLHVHMADAASSADGALSVEYYAETWRGLSIADGTRGVSGKTLSAGGSVTWDVPVDWATRAVNGSDPRYWARLRVSATPTGAKATQIGVIRRSLLCAPATFRTLTLIFREAPSNLNGPWADKAAWYEREAETTLQRALPLIGGEFDTDDSDEISPEEAAQTSAEVGGGGWILERM